MLARGHRFGRAAAFAAGVVVTAGVLAVPQAVGAVRSAGPGDGPGGDRTAPRVDVDTDQSFLVGSQLDAIQVPRQGYCDYRQFHTTLPVRWSWRVSDRGGSGLATVVMGRRYGNDWYDGDPTTARSYTRDAYDLPWPMCGGGGAIGPDIDPEYRIVATDGAGNSASVGPVRFGIVLTNQEDGSSTSGGFAMTANRSRGWTTSTCDCFDAGAAWTSTARDARIRYGFSTDAGQHVGLVMATGPDRGAVRVDVDGRRVATVDTWARDRRDRVVVWESALGAGRHTVTLTNLGTARRSRLDVDEVLLTAPHPG